MSERALTIGLAVASAVLLFARYIDRIARFAGSACLALIPASIITVSSFPGELKMGFWLTSAGSLTGVISGFKGFGRVPAVSR